MMQNVQNLEADIMSDLQKLKEEFESAVNSLSPVGIPEYSRPKERSFFIMLDQKGKSENTETKL